MHTHAHTIHRLQCNIRVDTYTDTDTDASAHTCAYYLKQLALAETRVTHDEGVYVAPQRYASAPWPVAGLGYASHHAQQNAHLRNPIRLWTTVQGLNRLPIRRLPCDSERTLNHILQELSMPT